MLISSTMDGKLITLTAREIEIKRRLVEVTKTVRMKFKEELEEAKRQEFEKTFKPMIEPLKSLATIRKEEVPVKSEVLEPEEKEEYTFEDTANGVLRDMINKQLANLRNFPNEFDTTYYHTMNTDG